MGLTAAEIIKEDLIFTKSNWIKFALKVRT